MEQIKPFIKFLRDLFPGWEVYIAVAVGFLALYVLFKFLKSALPIAFIFLVGSGIGAWFLYFLTSRGFVELPREQMVLIVACSGVALVAGKTLFAKSKGEKD